MTQFDESVDRPWIAQALRAINFGDWSPQVEAYVNQTGEDVIGVQMLGKKAWAKLNRMAKYYQFQIKFWNDAKPKDELSDKQKGWMETRMHGILESSALYVQEDDNRKRFSYDGDMSDDGKTPLDQQGRRGFCIPYLRVRVAYCDVVNKVTHEAGEIITDGKYQQFAIYVAKGLPNETYYHCQEVMKDMAENKSWDKFHRLSTAFKQYRQMMRDAHKDIQTIKNGRKYVYYHQFGGFVLFSPIVMAELRDDIREAMEARRMQWRQYNDVKDRLEATQAELLTMREQIVSGLLMGDDAAHGVYLSQLHKLVDDVKIHAPWLYKDLLKPFYKEIYNRDSNDAIFGEDGLLA